MKSTLRAISFPLVRFYFSIRSWYPVWFFLLNHEGKTLFKKNPSTLDAVQERVIQDFIRDGIASVHIDELFPGENLLPVLQTYVAQGKDGAETKMAGKKFLKQLWDMAPMLDFDNALMMLPLRQRIIDIVNTYMKMCSRFYYLTLNVTTPVAVNAETVASQRWHRDPEDRRMCKIFLYLNNVDEHTGPFEYVPGSQRGGIYGNLFPQRPPKGALPGDKKLEAIIPKSAIRSYTGPAGTLIFCDTIGLHRGGYAKSKERIMFTAGFCSSASVWPIRLKYPHNFNEKIMNTKNPHLCFALKPISRSFSTRFFDRIKRVYTYD